MKNLMKKDGFTLVELMVVVAIIGILSAVAIPNFRKFQSKSKTSEAKLQLASLYTAEASFYTDYDTYHSCLTFMGFSAPTVNNYYALGFATVYGTPAPTSAGGCSSTATSGFNFPGTKQMGSNTAMVGADLDATSVVATADTFTAQALGVIDKGAITKTTADSWTIDEDKTLVHVRAGY